jgi:hypothetical protein
MTNEVTSADGGWRVLFAFAAQWPAAAEFLRWALAPMKSAFLFVSMCAVILTSGCGDSAVVSKPDTNAIVGVWVADTTKSTCPSSLISNRTQLLLRQDGTFLAESFPKEVSLGSQSSVTGRWSLKNESGRWNLDLPWETPSKSILDGARLITGGKEIFVEIWIGDPDTHSRLVLRRQTNSTAPNPAASGNGAATLVFHVGRSGRAVPEPQCWARRV